MVLAGLMSLSAAVAAGGEVTQEKWHLVQRAEISNSSSKWQRMNWFVCVWFCFTFKGERAHSSPLAAGAWGGGSKPWAQVQIPEQNLTSSAKRYPRFCLDPGRTEGDNSDHYGFSSEALSTKPLSFPSYFGDRKVPGGCFQPNMKAPILSREELLDWDFFLFPQERAVIPSPCQTFLIYMYSLEGID